MKSADSNSLPYWPRGLSRPLAAAYVGVSPSTFDRLVFEGKMPKPKRAYGRRVWDLQAVNQYFDALPGDMTGVGRQVSVEDDWDDAEA